MEISPYIQQHFFDFEPIVPKTGGYAAFVDILGRENTFKISFLSSTGRVSLDEVINRPSGFTYAQSSASREKTSSEGGLKAGVYQFNISLNGSIDKKLNLEFKPSPLSIPQIEVTQFNKYWEVCWQEAPFFSNYWVFALPEGGYTGYDSIFKKVTPLTKNKFNGTSLKIKKNPFGEGLRYRILIRANQEEEKNGFPRFSKEAWGISSVLV